ncbi:hypothetical protein ACVQ8P_06945 [Dellaglioa sp. BT-FLS60]
MNNNTTKKAQIYFAPSLLYYWFVDVKINLKGVLDVESFSIIILIIAYMIVIGNRQRLKNHQLTYLPIIIDVLIILAMIVMILVGYKSFNTEALHVIEVALLSLIYELSRLFLLRK